MDPTWWCEVKVDHVAFVPLVQVAVTLVRLWMQGLTAHDRRDQASRAAKVHAGSKLGELSKQRYPALLRRGYERRTPEECKPQRVQVLGGALRESGV